MIFAALSIATLAPTAGRAQADAHLVEQHRFGTAEGGPYGLTRVTRAALGPHGRIYVAQPLEHTVRVYDADGRFVRYVGRRGEGPGEFQGLTNLGFVGDTLWVVDRRLGRVSFFSADGHHLNTESILAEPKGVALRAMPADAILADGGSLALLGVPARQLARGEVTRLPLVWVGRSDGETRTIVEVDYSKAFYELRGGAGEAAWSRTGPQPFVRPSLTALAPDGSLAVVVTMDEPRMVERGTARILGIKGSGQRDFERVVQFEAVALVASVADSVLGQMQRQHAGSSRVGEPGRRDVAAALREVIHRPAYVPPVDALVVSADGKIWLRRNVLGATGDSQTWFVLDTALQRIGTVEAPHGIGILAVEGDYAWAVAYDKLDVPTLIRYRVVVGDRGKDQG